MKEKKKFDFKKGYPFLFKPSAKQAEIVDVPPFKYIQISGEGNPNTSAEYAAKIQVLYSLSFTVKFMLKKDGSDPFDYTVAPLSGLWHADDMAVFKAGNYEQWKWTMMILQPDRVTETLYGQAIETVRKKKNLPHIDEAALNIYDEGKCAQILHIGPYAEEAPTIDKLHRFFEDKGYTYNGLHHEIYLGDPRKTAPEKLKTIIRQPIRKI